MLVLFVVKELFQAVMGIIHLRRGRMLPGALMAGKVCTTVLFVSLIAMVLLPGLERSTVTLIAVVDSVFLLISFVSYIRAYFQKNSPIQDL